MKYGQCSSEYCNWSDIRHSALNVDRICIQYDFWRRYILFYCQWTLVLHTRNSIRFLASMLSRTWKKCFRTRINERQVPLPGLPSMDLISSLVFLQLNLSPVSIVLLHPHSFALHSSDLANRRRVKRYFACHKNRLLSRKAIFIL